MIEISQDFDGGSVAIEKISRGVVSLRLRPDVNAKYRQWFWFRSRCHSDYRRTIELDVNESSFGGFDNYQPFARCEGQEWQRLQTAIRDRVFYFNLLRGNRWIDFAYFHPYSYGDHRESVDLLKQIPGVGVTEIGFSIEGRAIELIRIVLGSVPSKRIWITARQHPSEVMGSHFVEGLIEEILDVSGLSNNAIELYVVPMVNPDGVFHGNSRTNYAGMDLNRAWSDTPSSQAPEVAALINAMNVAPPDLYLDIHGVEVMPHCFLQPPEGVAGRSKAMMRRFARLECQLMNQASVIQNTRRFGYSGDPSIASNWVTERYNCLGVTLEIPFSSFRTQASELPSTADTCRALGRNVANGLADFLHNDAGE